jgi:hypothetical protein
MGINQPKSVEFKIRGHKLCSANWQGVLERKGVKQGLGKFVYFLSSKTCRNMYNG